MIFGVYVQVIWVEEFISGAFYIKAFANDNFKMATKIGQQDGWQNKHIAISPLLDHLGGGFGGLGIDSLGSRI